MTKQQALAYVRTHDDADDLDTSDLEAAFTALFERPATDEDRVQGLWSHICAAAE